MRELSPASRSGLIFWVMFSAYAFTSFHRLSTSAAAHDIIRSLQIDSAQFGVLGSMTFYGYAFVQPLAGFLSDTLGVRKTCTFGLAMAGVAACLFGYITWFPGLLLARFLIGAGVGAICVCAWKIFTVWFTPEQYTKVVCYFLAAAGVGGLIAASPLTWMNSLFGWRSTSFIMGVATCLGAVLIWVAVQDKKDEQPVYAKEIKRATRLSRRQSLRQFADIMLQTLGQRQFWLLACWYCSIPTVTYVFNGLWAGPFLADVYNLGSIKIGAILSMTAISITVTIPIFVYLIDVVFKSRRKVLLLSSCFTFGALLCIIFLPTYLSIPSLYVICFLTPFGDSVSGGLVSLMKEAIQPEICGTALGVLNTFLFGFSAIFQTLIGFILEHLSETGVSAATAYSIAFSPLALMVVLGILVCIRYPD